VDVADFDFELPDELIAQDPPPVRGESRLLVMRRDRPELDHTTFPRLPEYLRAGDLLVLNNTRVFPARLIGRREPSGGVVECLLLRQLPTPNSTTPGSTTPNSTTPNLEVGPFGAGSSLWEALVHPGQKLKPGALMVFEWDGTVLRAEVVGRHFHGRRTIRLQAGEGVGVMEAIERIGHVPLPPYIKRPDRPSDRERYQTVYARACGSVAAPTAGLHFTTALLDELARRGVERTEVTLHVGYGTFKPIRSARIEDHIVDPEPFIVEPAAADALTRARRDGRRVIAVGTTTVRVLESLAIDPSGSIAPSTGSASLFIRPGHEFRVVGGLITNFHLPRSSLFVLVCAFAGRERMLDVYREAIAHRYRFYSYGEGMAIL
jgi:S-adenosylmethionine:tRNA ribosyltransferase-isomerase